MKKHFKNALALSILAVSVIFFSCHSDNGSDIDYSNESKKIENTFLKEYTPKIPGNWKVEKMVLVPNEMSDIFKKDTILYNLGTIDIDIEEKEMQDNRLRFYLNGYFYINQEIIPFRSSLVHPNHQGKLIFSLIKVDPKYFPEPVMNYDQLANEYHLLDGYFFGDNYEMTFSEDGKTWIWKGSRSAKEIILTKID